MTAAEKVLILVVMDMGFWRYNPDYSLVGKNVLILVVMDMGFWHRISVGRKDILRS